MTCHGCGKQKIQWAFATFRTRTGEVRRRGICRDCRGKYARKKFRVLQAYRRKYNRKNRHKKALRDTTRRAEVKAYIDKIKTATPCADCRKKFPPVCMDFDHVEAKVRTVSGLVSGAYRLELVKEEIARCELVCANCHRIRTAKRKQNVAPRKKLIPRVVRVSARRLSEKHIRSVQSDYSAGENHATIRARYKISAKHLSAIVRRLKVWRP
jgi:hypothetical protein